MTGGQGAAPIDFPETGRVYRRAGHIRRRRAIDLALRVLGGRGERVLRCAIEFDNFLAAGDVERRGDLLALAIDAGAGTDAVRLATDFEAFIGGPEGWH